MSENAGVTGELDRLLSTLESLLEPVGADSGRAREAPEVGTRASQMPAAQRGDPQRKAPAGDAIDAVLASPARTTGVRSLRSSPEIEAFRQALVDGLIRADTVNRLLRLVNEVVGQLIR